MKATDRNADMNPARKVPLRILEQTAIFNLNK